MITKLVTVHHSMQEVIHVCRPNGISSKEAVTYTFKLFPKEVIVCPTCGGTYYRKGKDGQ